ncbi:hypothetical protein GQ457_10G009930 [Hibiscus cannabinus]
MSSYLLPCSLVEEMSRSIRRFWWFGKGSARGWPLVAWDDLCLPKATGGIEFKDLHLFNIAALGTQILRLLSVPGSLLYRTLCAKYFPDGDLLHALAPACSSFAWKGLHRTMLRLRDGLFWTLGIDSQVRLFRDRWGGFSLVTLVGGSVDREEIPLRCREFMVPGQARWDRSKLLAHLSPGDVDSILEVPISPDRADTLVWGDHDSGFYTVRPGSVKINVDGAFLPSACLGAIGVISRDSSGVVLGGFAKPVPVRCPASTVEVSALFVGLEFAIANGWASALIESDVVVLVNKLHRPTMDLSLLGDLLAPSHTLLDASNGCLRVGFASRSANSAAHALASRACHNANVTSFSSVCPELIPRIVCSCWPYRAVTPLGSAARCWPGLAWILPGTLLSSLISRGRASLCAPTALFVTTFGAWLWPPWELSLPLQHSRALRYPRLGVGLSGASLAPSSLALLSDWQRDAVLAFGAIRALSCFASFPLTWCTSVQLVLWISSLCTIMQFFVHCACGVALVIQRLSCGTGLAAVSDICFEQSPKTATVGSHPWRTRPRFGCLRPALGLLGAVIPAVFAAWFVLPPTGALAATVGSNPRALLAFSSPCPYLVLWLLDGPLCGTGLALLALSSLCLCLVLWLLDGPLCDAGFLARLRWWLIFGARFVACLVEWMTLERFSSMARPPAFVQGRAITDNILVAHEIVHTLHTSVSRSSQGAIFKLDMEKAFDRVEWPFLKAVMLRLGFAPSWVDLIMRCVSSVSSRVRVRGALSEAFRPQRGLRQGDPLSPFLFLFCTEGLSAALTAAQYEGHLPGVRASKHGPPVNHLLFADDNLVFLRSNMSEVHCLKDILSTYSIVSGQKVNFSKSTTYFSPRTPSAHRIAVHETLGVQEVDDPGIYLGVPLVIGKNKYAAFGRYRDKVDTRVSKWSNLLLSFSGREVLIKSVAQALPQYVMSFYLLPCSLVEEMSCSIRRFWWSGKGSARGWPLVASDDICLPKSTAGIGFKDLHLFNIALLGKQIWRLLSAPGSLLYRTLRAKYFPDEDLLSASAPARSSFAWKGLHRVMLRLRDGFFWTLGVDCQVRLFRDRWRGASIFCFSWMTKGMSRQETTGPALADYLGWNQISAERLAELLAYV